MTSYSGNSRPRDRARAIAAVVAIHVALAAVILAGLNVDKVRQAVDQLQTFDIRETLPPPPHPLARQPRKVRLAAGAPAPKAQATRVVAPKAPAPTPIPAAPVAGTGSTSTSGAASAGSGTGAGGNGNGPGAGSNGAGFTPAQLIANIPSSQYDRLASTGMPSGLVGVTILVGPDGRPGNCRIARSSGDSGLDGLVCQLTVRYVRFAPARDPSGRPVGQDITYFPNWRHR